jgi:hypothetical protein
VFCLYLHYHPFGIKGGENSVGHLAGQPFLYLRAPGGYFQSAGQLAESSYFTIGYVGQMGLTKEGEQVVLAHRIKGDITQHHRVGVLYFKYSVDSLYRFQPDTGEQLGVHAGYPSRGALQAVPVRVFPESFQDIANCLFDALLLDNVSLSADAFGAPRFGIIPEL